jgi:aldehyde dehydrogenase (NAD+)
MHYRMLIGGEWIDSDERYEIVNPANEEIVGTLAKGDIEHVDAAVAAAGEAFRTSGWRERPMNERAAMMDTIAAQISGRAEELAMLAARENGTPCRLAQGLAVGFPIAHIQHFANRRATSSGSVRSR